MKVIINVNPKSAYKHLNGRTFPAAFMRHGNVHVFLDKVVTDFIDSEVTVVDIDNEVQDAIDTLHNENNQLNRERLAHLSSYVTIKGIELNEFTEQALQVCHSTKI